MSDTCKMLFQGGGKGGLSTQKLVNVRAKYHFTTAKSLGVLIGDKRTWRSYY